MFLVHGDDRRIERDLVEYEVVADGIDGLLKARCFRDELIGDVRDAAEGFYGMTAGADVLDCAVVGNGGEMAVNLSTASLACLITWNLSMIV